MTSFAIKIVAILSMTLDHVIQFLPCSTALEFLGIDRDSAVFIVRILGGMGRMAFPIFAFLIGEGCKHSHDPSRYVGRLLAFSLISELPFRWVHGNGFLSVRTGNIFFTLALGAIACILFQKLWGSQKKVFAVCVVILFAIAAEIWRTDYGALGVLLIVLPFAFRRRAVQLVVIGILLTILYMGVASWNGIGFGWMRTGWYVWNWVAALGSLVFIGMYSGKRGKNTKWFFYWFYPAHLAIIAAIQFVIS